MPRLTLRVRNAAAVVANLRAFDRRYQREVRAAVRVAGHYARTRVQAYAPVRTGFMRRGVRTTFSDDALSYTVGWDAADFTKAGKPFYPPYQEYGTVTIAPRPSLGPGGREGAEYLRQRLRAALQASVARQRR